MSAEAKPPSAELSPLMTRLVRAASWTLAGAVGSQVLGFAGGLLTARLLGNESFGQLSAVRGLLLAFGIFSGAGLGLAAVRYVAEFRDSDPARMAGRIQFLQRLSWMCAGVTAVIAACLTPWMSDGWLGEGSLRNVLWLGCPLVLFNGLSAIQNGILGGLEKFKAIARGMAVEATGNLLGVVFGAKVAGMGGAVGGACVAGGVAWVYRRHLLRQEGIRLQAAEKRNFDKGWLLHEAMPFIIAGTLSQPFEWFARLSLVRQPEGFVQLGYFSAAFTCAQVIAFLPRQFTVPGVALLAGLAKAQGAVTAVEVVRMNFKLLMLLASLAAIPMLLAADFILRLFGFTAGGDVLVVLVLANVAGVCSGFFRTILSASGKIWWQCGQVLVWSVVLVLTWLALEEYGALGLACAYLAAFVVVLFPQGRAARVCLQESGREDAKAGAGSETKLCER
ncbi:MAG TPA: oligosaccharide flippase family protein [Verrucomicrobiae bacterium]